MHAHKAYINMRLRGAGAARVPKGQHCVRLSWERDRAPGWPYGGLMTPHQAHLVQICIRRAWN
jgi:hypothetical protein